MALILHAIRFVQKNIPMYLAALPVEELDYCSVDSWDPRKTGKWKGYQRGLVQKKIRDLAAYLERPDGILPVAGLLNVRENNRLKFKGPKSKTPSNGILTIPDYTRLWVVDMQHRLEGIKTAYSQGFLERFSVAVLITEGLNPVKEAGQFYIINTRARRMGVDLTRRLLIEHDQIKDLTDVKEWELKAVQVTIRLNKFVLRNNPWYGRIREPEIQRLEGHIATEKSFVPSLKWLLSAPAVRKRSVASLARFLASMWEGLRLNMPEAFEKPKGFVIQKTPGYMAFHRLAPIIYRRTKKKGHNVMTFKAFFRVFEKDTRYNYKFWDRRNPQGAKRFGTGQSAYTQLAITLGKKLGIKYG